MTQQRWRQIKDLYYAALERAAVDRLAFVASASEGDEALRAEVARLLSSQGRHSGFLDPPNGPDGARSDRTTPNVAGADLQVGETLATPHGLTGPTGPSEQPGTQIGRYKLLDLIGEGGFGCVYLAEQQEPVRRRVAMKIIKLGMDTRQVVARFEAERQALAMMDHQHIARVLDAGATTTGRPYFVMELVKGDPITEYCDRNKLSIVERLELFKQVCLAVQHAHTKSIIHRDLKPSNVLVSTQDGRPHAKVIDFGIAKATATQLTEKTLYTEHRQLIGTPAYMSPEQAEGSMDIDTRTDVYSLGVLLYELLTGQMPFDPRQLRSAGFAEIQRIIRDVEPARPSTRLTQSVQALPLVAAQRRQEPRRLSTMIRGDLDWIVMKCLEKDRGRRYEMASDVAADIRRHLAREPVLAGPPSAMYRFDRFMRRHQIAFWVTCAILLLISGTVTTIVRMAKAHVQAIGKERDRAAAAAVEAEAAREKTAKHAEHLQQVNDLLQSLFLRPIEIYPTADRLFDAYLRRAEAVFGKNDPLVTAAMTGLGDQLAADMARVVDADAVLGRSIEYTTRALGADHVSLAKLHRSLSRIHFMQLAPAALEHSRTAVRICEKSLGADHLETAVAREALSLTLIALAQGDLSRFREAEQQYRHALTTYQRVLSADHPRTIELKCGLAQVIKILGRTDEAEPMLTEALSMAESNRGVRATIRFTTARQLADVLRTRGDRDRAIAVYMKLPALAADAFDRNGPTYNQLLMSAAEELRAIGETEAATKLVPESVRINMLHMKAAAAAREKSYEQVLAYAEEALQLAPTGLSHYNVACAHALLGQADKAFEHLYRVIDLGMPSSIELRARIESDTDFDNIRSDPRYPVMLEKAGNQPTTRTASQPSPPG